LCLVLTSAALATNPARKLGFARDDNTVWVANLDGTGARKIAAGVDPDISPDGTKLAFNTEEKGTTRRIAIADLPTGEVTIFKDVPSDNSYGPLWSPDGTKLLFYVLIDETWDIGVANADGSAFHILKKGGPNDHSYFSACWMPDGRSLFCQDLENLYHIGLDGAVIKQWPLRTLFTEGDMDSGVRFGVSPDGRTLLVELSSGDASGRKDWDGPAPSIWAMDVATGSTRKVTPVFWWEPCWVTKDDFVCISQGAKEKRPSIYRVWLDGKKRKLLVKNGTDPSVSK
jgi:TolB protein